MNNLIDQKIKQESYWETVYNLLVGKISVKKADLDVIFEQKSDIQNSLLDGSYKFGTPRKIEVKKDNGKSRVVYLFDLKDRVVIGVLYRVLNEFFGNRVSENCFSYKTHTTTLDAIKYLKIDKQLNSKYCMKLDISHYFNSVSEKHIKATINKLFKGYEDSICYKYLNDIYNIDTCYWGSKEIQEFLSLIPGTSLSNLLGNHCLKDVDDYFKNTEGVSYARYSDDIVMFASTREELNKYFQVLCDMIADYGLEIKEEKCQIFEPHEFVTFLGLRFNDKTIDLSRESVKKLKKRIKSMCKEGRKKIVKEGKPYKEVATKIIRSINHFMYTCYIDDKTKYGWAYYAFRYINTDESIREIDFYLRDTLRWLKTGKYNSANIKKTSNEELHEMGYRSAVMLYKVFKTDFDVYCSMIDLIEYVN